MPLNVLCECGAWAVERDARTCPSGAVNVSDGDIRADCAQIRAIAAIALLPLGYDVLL